MSLAKWILGGLGFALSGPIGAIMGYVIGSLFSSDNEVTFEDSGSSSSSQATEGDISVSLLVLIACVIKADGKVLKSEINYLKPFLLKAFGEEKAKDALQVLKKLLEQDIDPDEVSRQIAKYVNYSTRLELVHMLLNIANADGEFVTEEEIIINRIRLRMNIKVDDYESLKATYRKVKEPNWAYAVLEIDPSATDEEVKKAYRRMAKKYHPDKVSNASEEIRQQATEKFRAVDEAYKHIIQMRCINNHQD